MILSPKPKITFVGLQNILKKCKHLRVISSATKLAPKEINKLLDCAPQLMCFGVVCGRHLNERELSHIIQRNGGHCVFEDILKGKLFRPGNNWCSGKVVNEYKRVFRIIVKTNRLGTANSINCWGDYFEG